MAQPKIEVLGAYKVAPTAKLFQEAMESKYGGIQLSGRDRKAAEEAIRQELSSIVLLDVLVRNPDEQFDVGEFNQPGSDQAPYDEANLSLDGTSVVSQSDPPFGDSLRVTFFLHFFDPSKPLASSFGEVTVPAVQEMTERFQEMIPYSAVD